MTFQCVSHLSEKNLAEHPFRNRDSGQHYIWQTERVICVYYKILLQYNNIQSVAVWLKNKKNVSYYPRRLRTESKSLQEHFIYTPHSSNNHYCYDYVLYTKMLALRMVASLSALLNARGLLNSNFSETEISFLANKLVLRHTCFEKER